MNATRREWLVGLSSLGAGAILIGCNKSGPTEDSKPRRDKEDLILAAAAARRR
jgi:hypothetical protein